MNKKIFLSFALALLLLATPALAIAPLVWALGVSVAAHVGLLMYEWTDDMNTPQQLEMNVTIVNDRQLSYVGQPPPSGGPYCWQAYSVPGSDECSDTREGLALIWAVNNGYNAQVVTSVRSIMINNYDVPYYQFTADIMDVEFNDPYGNPSTIGIKTISAIKVIGDNTECPQGMVPNTSGMGECVMELPDNEVDLYVDSTGKIRTDLDTDSSSIQPPGFLSINGEVRWDTPSASGYGQTENNIKYDTTTGNFILTETNSAVPVTQGGSYNGVDATVTQTTSTDGAGNVQGESLVLTYDNGSNPQEGDLVGSTPLGPGSGGPGSTVGDTGTGLVVCSDGSLALTAADCPVIASGAGGTCGGPSEPVCDVNVIGDISINETGISAPVASSEYDGVLAGTGIDDAIANIGNVDSSIGPDKIDFGIESYFPDAGICSDYSYSFNGYNITIPLATSPHMGTLRDLFGWFVYLLTALYLYHLATQRST